MPARILVLNFLVFFMLFTPLVLLVVLVLLVLLVILVVMISLVFFMVGGYSFQVGFVLLWLYYIRVIFASSLQIYKFLKNFLSVQTEKGSAQHVVFVHSIWKGMQYAERCFRTSQSF